MYILKFNCLKKNVFIFYCIVFIYLEIKRDKMVVVVRYGWDWFIYGEDMFEVFGGVD